MIYSNNNINKSIEEDRPIFKESNIDLEDSNNEFKKTDLDTIINLVNTLEQRISVLEQQNKQQKKLFDTQYGELLSFIIAVAHSTQCIKTRSIYYKTEEEKKYLLYQYGLKQYPKEIEIEQKHDKTSKKQRLNELKTIAKERGEISTTDAIYYFKEKYGEEICYRTVIRYFEELDYKIDEDGCGEFVMIIPDKTSKKRPFRLKYKHNVDNNVDTVYINDDVSVKFEKLYKEYHE